MPYNFNQSHLINVYIIFSLSVVCLLVSNVKCHKCYVCGGGHDEPSCDNFDPSSEVYIKDCPPGMESCLLQKDEHVTTRSCEPMRVNDCQQANGVLYCYCLKELCNDVEVSTSTYSDDEDMEGSGFSRKSNTKEVDRTTTEVTKQPPTNSGSISSISNAVLVAILLMN